MEKKVVAKYLRISPKKVRTLLYELKGKNAEVLLTDLALSVKKGAVVILKAIKSGIYQFDQNVRNAVVVKHIAVTKGPNFKRFRPGSKGMANNYVHKTAHLEVILEVKTK